MSLQPSYSLAPLAFSRQADLPALLCRPNQDEPDPCLGTGKELAPKQQQGPHAQLVGCARPPCSLQQRRLRPNRSDPPHVVKKNPLAKTAGRQ